MVKDSECGLNSRQAFHGIKVYVVAASLTEPGSPLAGDLGGHLDNTHIAPKCSFLI
jgi:hypothetical protein